MKYITYAFFLILIFYNIRNKRSKSQKVVKYTSKSQTPLVFPPQYGNSSFQNSYIGSFNYDEDDCLGGFQRGFRKNRR